MMIPAVTLACEQYPTADPTAAGSPAFIVHDSAGIQIVENHRPVWDSNHSWTLDPEPEFVIGGHHRTSPGPDETTAPVIWNVKGAARLADGRLAVLSHGSDHKVLIFEPSGRLSTSFGRSGRGPGEISNPQHLQVLPGDTVVVWEAMFGPVNYFDVAGNLLKYRQIDLGAVFAAIEAPGRIPGESVRLPLPDGSFLLNAHRRNWDAPQGIFRPPMAFLRVDAAYRPILFGWWEGLEQFSISRPGPALGYLPYRAQSMSAAGGDPVSVYITNGDRYEVHQFSTTGVLRRVIRRTIVQRTPITTSEVVAWKEELTQVLPMMDWALWDRERSPLGQRFHAPISAIVVDSEGFLWLQSANSDWSVFDQDGRWLGAPEHATGRIVWIGDDLVIRIRSHPDTGVESVEGLRLDRNYTMTSEDGA